MKNSSLPFLHDLEASWQEILRDELQKPYIQELSLFVESEYKNSPATIYPRKELIFNAFQQTPFDKVQVVILGQDPYHGPNQAHGLSFSVPKGVKLPPSLKNIFKELKEDLPCVSPLSNGCLIPWAKQGILLLNATLTVAQGKPLSHQKKGWERFTDAVIANIYKKNDPVIFVLWGNSAQEKTSFLIDKKSPHTVLTAAHPSPFSANRGFFGCRHFSQINTLLNKQNKPSIDWCLP